ncbi:Por secretion system C-terminal sorting domain-containing protein [Tenacibaculum sp. MAR_2009_124]|uniref:T9SS type A sorting domain-containing protein n=1 Tax=Tenacibaculum sp. MAR_2009_124 TaxID=1250059 RepID=UPI0008997921|nr:T9SS type A sorting domain-containing protein [Tenacibaculum sp. MAR_2009_124]SEC34849.1 Por secretion system C-terminal sorting domain-containing protein [Tenacibaculum sp. MAR_2009_124]
MAGQSNSIVNVPDTSFKNYLIGNEAINTNNDNEIQVSEANAFSGKINCHSLGIQDLKGIEAFINLKELDCSKNSLTSLDVSQNTKLTWLRCGRNNLTSLDVTNNLELRSLSCNRTSISSIDVTRNTKLNYLMIYDNDLSSIDVTNNVMLNHLWIRQNKLTNLDLSKNLELRILSCSSNRLRSLDISHNTNLITLACGQNELDLINTLNNRNLSVFSCGNNAISELDLSNNTALKVLYCARTKVRDLDLSANINLERLTCHGTELHSLNLKNGNNIKLTQLRAYNNPNLTCIQVGNLGLVNNRSDWNVDDSVTFNVQCATASVYDLSFSNDIQITPNPVKDLLSIEVEDYSTFESCAIFNITGQEILNTKDMLIDMSHISEGVYIVKITGTDKKVAVKKIFKS